MGNQPSVEYPTGGRCLSADMCYICWQNNTDKKIFSPCDCQAVVHTTCLVKYIKLGNFSCPICEISFVENKKKKKTKQKKLKIAIEKINKQYNSPANSPITSAACTPTCGLKHIFTR